MRHLFYSLLFISVFASGRADALEYPIQVGTQAIYDATTTVTGQFPIRWRYELWVLDARKKGGFDAVWATYSGVGQPNETLAGAVPLILNKDGSKSFPTQREATYPLQEQVESFVPKLPAGFDQPWRGPASVTNWYGSYQPVEVLADRIRCSFAQYGVSKIDQVFGTETLGEAYFDTRYNWLREVSFTTKRPSPQGMAAVTQVKVTLSKALHRDANWAAGRKDEAKKFFSALTKHDDLLLKANDDLSAATIDLRNNFALWEKFLAKNGTSRFFNLAKNQFEVLKMSVPSLQQLWAHRRGVIGNPSPSWTLMDTQGGSYSLQSFNSPVLLLFWTRTSWWSLISILDIQKIQAEYQGKGLLVLPINVDNTDQEAVQSLQMMGAGVTTLRNTDPNLVLAYGIPLGVFPSTVLLDPSKKIVDVRYGWGGQVVRELRKRIEDLL